MGWRVHLARLSSVSLLFSLAFRSRIQEESKVSVQSHPACRTTSSSRIDQNDSPRCEAFPFLPPLTRTQTHESHGNIGRPSKELRQYERSGVVHHLYGTYMPLDPRGSMAVCRFCWKARMLQLRTQLNLHHTPTVCSVVLDYTTLYYLTSRAYEVT